jgi:hypothetical protein
MAPDDRPRRPWLLGLVIVLITGAVVVALVTSETSGTGAVNVGDDGSDPVAEAPAPSPQEAERDASASPPAPRRDCEATQSNPGGTNNYIPAAPTAESLGEGFVITGLVRSARGCRPLEDVRVQVWLATETGGEQDNRASVRTGSDGRYRIETAKTVPQFGEPNIHVGYDDGDYGEVFIRRVVDLDDKRAVVDLTLARRG